MAAEAPVPSGFSNPCCAELRRRLDEAKVSLKQAMNFVERQQAEIKEEKLKTKLVKEARKRETFIRKNLENDILELKAQVASLSQETKNLLVAEKSDGELERVKQHLEEEKKKTHSEKMNATKALNMLQIEKGKVEKERQLVQIEQTKATQLSASFEKLEREFVESRDRLTKKIEEEKQKANREKRRADTEKAKLEEQKKYAEIEKKRAHEEKSCTDSLLNKLEEERENIKDLLKKLEEERKRNKCFKDKLAMESTQKEKHSVSAKKEGLSVMLLKEKLKVRKAQLKHEKRMLKLEKAKNNIIKQELSLLKQDFIQISSRFKVLDSHLDVGGSSGLTKVFLTHAKQVPPLTATTDRPISLKDGGDQHMIRQSQSRPASGTSSESLLPSLQNFAFYSDKKLLGGPHDTEKDASVSSPPLLKNKKNAEAYATSTLEALNKNHKRKRKESINPMKKVKVQNVNIQVSPEAVEFEKVVREGGVLKLLEFEDEGLEKKFRSAMEGLLSPNLPQIAARENVKVSYNGNINNMEGKYGDEHVISKYDLKSKSKWKGTVRADQERHERVHCFNENEETLEGGNEKHSHLFFIVFSNMSESSITRAGRIWNEITGQKSVSQTIDLSARVLQLASNSEFLPEDKISVICSLLASETCRVLMSHSDGVSNFYFDKHISYVAEETCSVLSEEMLHFFVKNNLLEKITFLFKDFFICKQLHVYKNGDLCSTISTMCQFISSCIIFALICAKTNELDLIRATAYEILLTGKSSICHCFMSTHIFASICGERLLENNEERLLQNVLRWVVYHIENDGIHHLEFPPCQQCPFNMKVADAEGFVDSLLDELEVCSLQNNQESHFACGGPCTCIAGRNGPCYFIDIISLLELVGSYMAWDCAFNNVVPRLWKIVESFQNEELAASILVLVGHLSSSFLGEGNYNQIQVSELRVKLSNFIQTKDKVGLALKFACISALLNLIPLNVNQILTEEEDIPSDNNEFCTEIRQIKSWFSGLSKEEKGAFQNFQGLSFCAAKDTA